MRLNNVIDVYSVIVRPDVYLVWDLVCVYLPSVYYSTVGILFIVLYAYPPLEEIPQPVYLSYI